MPTVINSQLSAVIDSYLKGLKDSDPKRLLEYSVNLHSAWTDTLNSFGIRDDDIVLDVGTGLGLIPFDIASKTTAKVVGCDISTDYIDHANHILKKMAGAQLLRDESRLSFDVANITSLPYDSNYFSKVIVREVFSYLSDPQIAAQELHRVSKLGAEILVEDIDDSLYITYPQPSQAFETLFNVVKMLQNDKGGDRNVGRKLSTYLSGSGLSIMNIKVITESSHLSSDQSWAEKEFIARQLIALKPQALERELASVVEFDTAFNSWLLEDVQPGFRMNARILVHAKKSVERFQGQFLSLN